MKTSPQDVVKLYRGQLLDDLYDDWILAEREALQRLYIDTLLSLCQQMRAQGEHQRTIEYSKLVLKADHPNEQAYQHLIFSHAVLGNRTAALELYEECKRVLEAELGVAPSTETIALQQWIQRTSSGPPSLSARTTNLPTPLTSFIGRRAEIQQIRETLVDTRLLTILGAGGSGKTRLAIQVAGELVDAFREGVWWIDLAPLNDERLIPPKVARTLGIPEGAGVPVTDTIIGSLRASQALLVLDNCEHLVRACAQLITALLTACPDLKVLVTSREALGVFGERVWRAPVMLLPEARALLTVEQLERYDGIRLFLERAAARRDFQLDERNAGAVLEICWKLDGIPLAIEMAAARVAVLPIQEIARRLDERFNLLTAGDRAALPRQQTLRATMDWSYDMLSSDEQLLFCQLSVFAGGFTVEAAESVCAAAGGKGTAVVDLLSNLVSKSLITIETQSGETRFRMLETILEYAREKLEHAVGREAVQRRHLDFFLALAEEFWPVSPWGTAEPARLNRLEAEQANLRAALRYSLEHGLTEQNFRLCTALTAFWYVRSDWVEGREWFEQALASRAARSVPTGLRADMLHYAGVFAYLQGDRGRAVELLEESRPFYEALQDARQLGWILLSLSQIALFEGNYSLAAQQAAQALGFFEKVHDKGAVANMKLYIGQIAYYQGDNSRARMLLGESLPDLKEIRDDVAEARALHALGLVEQKEGNDNRAGALFRESLLAARRKGDRLDMIRALEGLGSVACSQERSIRSAILWGAAEAQRSLIQSTPEYGVRVDNDRAIAVLRAKLDAAAFARAWEQGADMTLEQAVEVALQSQDA